MTLYPQDLYKVVRVYAFEKGHPVLTWEDFLTALKNYEVYATKNN